MGDQGAKCLGIATSITTFYCENVFLFQPDKDKCLVPLCSDLFEQHKGTVFLLLAGSEAVYGEGKNAIEILDKNFGRFFSNMKFIDRDLRRRESQATIGFLAPFPRFQLTMSRNVTNRILAFYNSTCRKLAGGNWQNIQFVNLFQIERFITFDNVRTARSRTGDGVEFNLPAFNLDDLLDHLFPINSI